MSCPENTVCIGPFVQGEVPPPFVYTFLDADGDPIDLSGGYTARFVYQERDGTPVTRTATVLAGTGGQVSYTWVAADFPSPGQYTGRMWAGNGANRWASVRILYDVAVPIGAVPLI